MKPVLYISFGMPKSGSTLAFNVVRECLLAAGHAQPQLLTEGDSAENFIMTIGPEELAEARAVAEAAGSIVAIKTHRRPLPCVAEGIREGWITGHAVCRDPRDIALSMIDASAKGLGWGGFQGRGFQVPDDTLGPIRRHVRRFQLWMRQPGILPVHYEMMAFETGTMVARICDQLGLTVNVPRVVRAAKRHRNQFNAGRSRRWQRELDPDAAERIGAEFAGFIAEWCSEMPGKAPRRGLLGRLRRQG